MKTLSHILSAIFSPLLLPTYGMMLIMFLTLMLIIPAPMRWLAICITFLVTAVIPSAVIFILFKTGRISDPGLNNRTERGLPYGVAVACYLICAWLFVKAAAPVWIPLFLAGGALAIIVSVTVNLKWKISAHSAGMGGLVALLFFLVSHHLALADMTWWICGSILMSGMVMSARIYLKRHTLMQTLAGFANGYLCVWLVTLLFVN